MQRLGQGTRSAPRRMGRAGGSRESRRTWCVRRGLMPGRPRCPSRCPWGAGGESRSCQGWPPLPRGGASRTRSRAWRASGKTKRLGKIRGKIYRSRSVGCGGSSRSARPGAGGRSQGVQAGQAEPMVARRGRGRHLDVDVFVVVYEVSSFFRPNFFLEKEKMCEERRRDDDGEKVRASRAPDRRRTS